MSIVQIWKQLRLRLKRNAVKICDLDVRRNSIVAKYCDARATYVIDPFIGSNRRELSIYPKDDTHTLILQYMIDNVDKAVDLTDYSGFGYIKHDYDTALYDVKIRINDLIFVVWVANFPYAVTNSIAVFKCDPNVDYNDSAVVSKLRTLNVDQCYHDDQPKPIYAVCNKSSEPDLVRKWCMMFVPILFVPTSMIIDHNNAVQTIATYMKVLDMLKINDTDGSKDQ